jgi:hypothetical protein
MKARVGLEYDIWARLTAYTSSIPGAVDAGPWCRLEMLGGNGGLHAAVGAPF